MIERNVKRIRWFIVASLVTLILIFFLRTFFIQSYMVSSSQMETSLLQGEYLLVDKTAYGVRMPITPLSIPFTFDFFAGFKSYSNLVQFGYKRCSGSPIFRDDIILFNNPTETSKPIDKRSLLLSRCVAIPGDTLTGLSDELFINGKKYIFSPDVLTLYRYNTKHESVIVSVMKLFGIPLRKTNDSIALYTSILLNKYETFILNQQLSSYLVESETRNVISKYQFVVPAKNMKIELTDYNIALLYKDIILDETQHEIQWSDNRLLKGGIPIKDYQFKEDYYWFISDNLYEGIDSRQLGFVSEKYIIGKASYIIFSPSNSGINWDRSLSAIN